MSRIDIKTLHAGPAVGFEQPYDMLRACHERVQRSLRLLLRLQTHVVTVGVDAQAREAAADVLRYFDLAGPAHHEDEERHVLPPLRASGDAALMALAERLHAEHLRMSHQWALLREPLQRIAAGDGEGDGDRAGGRAGGRASDCAALEAEACATFAQLYDGHIAAEEALAYPASEARTPPDAWTAIGEEMAARRRPSP